jgi:acetolactate synthase I/II/III large subunit
MTGVIAKYFGRGISRRGFVNRLVGMGFTIANADIGLPTSLTAADQAEQITPGPGYGVEGTGGFLVVEQAKAAGVEFVFTNPGSFELGFFDALVDQPEIEIITSLHEGVVISMADGYAKVSGKPAFVNVHAIAGTAQMGGQLYNAGRDGTPLIITAGLVDNESWNDDQVLAPRPGFDEKDVTREFTKISWDARQAASLPMMLRRAFKVATTEPSGPVFLSMGRVALQTKGVKAQILPADRFLFREQMRPETSAIQEAARLLIQAKRPVLVVGDEIWKSGAQAEIVALSERLGMAVYDTRSSFANFPTQHPHYLGMPGDGFNLNIMKTESARLGIDVLVMAGARDLGGEVVPESPELPPQARVIRMGLDTGAMSRNYQTDVALVGSMRETLGDLVSSAESLLTKEKLSAIGASRSQEVRSISTAQRKEAIAMMRANFGRSPIHPDELGAVLARTIDQDAIVVDENFTGQYGSFSFGFRDNEQMRLATSAASLGWGIGAATGAKIGAPDRQVVCSIGDGAVMYSASGFWTQARFNIPVLTVISNNYNYQVVRWAQDDYKGRMASSGHYPGMYLGDPNIDFVKLAESQGVKAERVTAGSELEAALKRGIAATRDGKPYVVEVVVARFGPGSDSVWHESFNLAAHRKRRV